MALVASRTLEVRKIVQRSARTARRRVPAHIAGHRQHVADAARGQKEPSVLLESPGSIEHFLDRPTHDGTPMPAHEHDPSVPKRLSQLLAQLRGRYELGNLKIWNCAPDPGGRGED